MDGIAYPPPDADLSDGTNAIWPMAAVLPVVPLTALPADAADWVVSAARARDCSSPRSGCFEVRDWRVYGVTLLWPPVIDAYQTGNVTLPLALLVALTWRYRDRAAPTGIALGVALALEVLPLASAALAGRRPPDEGRARRGGARRRLPAPAPAVHQHRGLPPAASQPERHLRRALVHALRAARRSRRAVVARAARRHSRPVPRCSRSPGGAGASASSSGLRSCSRPSSGGTSSPLLAGPARHSRGRGFDPIWLVPLGVLVRSRARTTAHRGKRLSAWPLGAVTVALAEREPLSANPWSSAPSPPSHVLGRGSRPN